MALNLAALTTSSRRLLTPERSFLWDFIYNDAKATRGNDSIFRYKWATSLSAHYDRDNWGFIADLIYGDNGDIDNLVFLRNRQGDFWGVVIMPYYWIIEDKLQAVARYQYAGSQNPRGTRNNSRYARRDHGPVVNTNLVLSGSGRGNEHHFRDSLRPLAADPTASA